MIEKVKDFFKYIFTPIALVLGYVFYLVSKNKSLEGEIGRLKADKESDKLIQEFEKAKVKGDSSEKDWESIRDRFIDPNNDNKGGTS